MKWVFFFFSLNAVNLLREKKLPSHFIIYLSNLFELLPLAVDVCIPLALTDKSGVN